MLTEEQIDNIWAELPPYAGDYRVILDFARAIEAAVIAAVDAERSKDAVAWFMERNGERVGIEFTERGVKSWVDAEAIPLYLSPAIPPGFAPAPAK